MQVSLDSTKVFIWGLIMFDPTSIQLNIHFPDDLTESEVVTELRARLPITTTNDLYAALITYKNAVVRELHNQGYRHECQNQNQ